MTNIKTEKDRISCIGSLFAVQEREKTAPTGTVKSY